MKEVVRTRRSRLSNLSLRNTGFVVVFVCVASLYSACRWYLDETTSPSRHADDTVPRVWEAYGELPSKTVHPQTSLPAPILQRIGAQLKNVRALESGKIEVQLEMNVRDFIDVIGQTNDRASQAIVEELPQAVSYNINSRDVCTKYPGVELIIYLHSSPSNYIRRSLIRTTWGNPALFKNGLTKVIFLVGLPRFDDKTRDTIQDSLIKEHEEYGDIIQGNFQDDYRNLTLKGIMGLHWVKNFCPMAKFALKSDDDVFINIFKLRTILKDKPLDTLACISYKPRTMPILRFPKPCAKWCIKYREMAGRHYYPQYCAGLAFAISRDLISKMYDQSLVTPFFWVDDAYITGLLTANIKGINRVPLNNYMSLFGRDAYREYTSNTAEPSFIFIHGIIGKQMIDMWESLLGKITLDDRDLLSDVFQEKSLKLYNERMASIAKNN